MCGLAGGACATGGHAACGVSRDLACKVPQGGTCAALNNLPLLRLLPRLWIEP